MNELLVATQKSIRFSNMRHLFSATKQHNLLHIRNLSKLENTLPSRTRGEEEVDVM